MHHVVNMSVIQSGGCSGDPGNILRAPEVWTGARRREEEVEGRTEGVSFYLGQVCVILLHKVSPSIVKKFCPHQGRAEISGVRRHSDYNFFHLAKSIFTYSTSSHHWKKCRNICLCLHSLLLALSSWGTYYYCTYCNFNGLKEKEEIHTVCYLGLLILNIFYLVLM